MKVNGYDLFLVNWDPFYTRLGTTIAPLVRSSTPFPVVTRLVSIRAGKTNKFKLSPLLSSSSLEDTGKFFLFFLDFKMFFLCTLTIPVCCQLSSGVYCVTDSFFLFVLLLK